MRHRYDTARRRRTRTVELIEEEAAWTPAAAIYLVKIACEDATAREKAKDAGARWNRERRLWVMSGEAVRRLGFEDRVIDWLEPGE